MNTYSRVYIGNNHNNNNNNAAQYHNVALENLYSVICAVVRHVVWITMV